MEEQRKVSAALAIGILLFPIIFSWVTLKKGYSTMARVLSFLWLIIIVMVAMTNVDNKINANETIQATDKKDIITETPKKTEVKVEKKFLPITKVEFINKYNIINSQEFENNLQLDIEKGTKTGNIITFPVNNNIAFNLDVEGDKLIGITYLGRGDGTAQSGIDMVSTIVATVMAIENPKMPADQRGQTIKDLGLLDSGGDITKIDKTTIRNGVKYHIMFVKDIGLMMTVSPN
ncbi:MAG: hypothetical protein SPI03_03645 [Campylobacter sputorum]|uniref:hypothetical protein n=1 Tax=Campylobacter sputorum TaxID=206 RepID=UPI002A910C51|nr:hypothetical protein [Campylobacter sputorum]MDY6120419.1 hypothetical protein [Campylobacter sputorum]